MGASLSIRGLCARASALQCIRRMTRTPLLTGVVLLSFACGPAAVQGPEPQPLPAEWSPAEQTPEKSSVPVLPLPASDAAPTLTVTGATTSTVTFRWTPPARPHADLRAYRIGWDTSAVAAPVKSWSDAYPSPANPYTLTNLAADSVYTLWMEALGPDGVAGPRTSVAQRTKAVPTTTGGLPRKVVGGYWQNWGLPSVTLGSVPAAYNVVFLAFALGVSPSSGALQWSQYVQTDASFKSDIRLLQGQGRKVILSIGGWFDLPNQTWGYSLGPDNTAARVRDCVLSIKALRSEYGFDGIDWDLEHLPQLYIPGLVAASRQLKAELGPEFIITAAPAPSNAGYTTLALQLGEDLDFIGPQYYDQDSTEAASRAQIVRHTKELIAAGIPADRVGIGTRTVGNVGSMADTSNVITLATINSAWDELEALYPTLRGAFAWSVNLDQSVGYVFANQISGNVKGQ